VWRQTWQMLSRQQRRSIERRLPEKRTPESNVGRAALSPLLPIFRVLLWPIRKLPLWFNILGALATSLFFYEVFVEAVPYIETDPATSSSWHDLPFKAKIDSHLFGASDVHIICAAENITWKTNPQWGMANIKANMIFRVNRVDKSIPPHGTISFACDVANTNSVTTLDNQVAPLSLVEIHVLILFKSPFWPWWQRQTLSPRFTWREVSPESYQWLEGEPRVP
jgi:hypothetical protein